MRAVRSALLLAATLLGGCASPHGFDREPLALSPEEQGLVSAQVGKAREAGEWTLAWNQSVDMGAGREALEDVALGALEAEDRGARDMLAALVGKWGGLTAAGKRRVQDAIASAQQKGDPLRAVDIAIAAADDAPAYADAWHVYAGAPAADAADVLERIREARRKHGGQGS